MDKEAREQLHNLYKMFVGLDLLQLEINPWATNDKNEIYCIDGKLNIDDNALYRHPELIKMNQNSLGSVEVDVHEQEVPIKPSLMTRL